MQLRQMTHLHTQQGVFILTLARGKVNALNEEMVDHLWERFQTLRDDRECRAVVFTGQGSFFSFGLDVPELYDYPPEAFSRFLTKFTGLYATLFEFPKPVVAAINGHAIAGGCMLATACDYRVMATGKAKISLNEVTFGSSLFAGSIEMLKYVAGQRNAETIALSGRMYSGEEARALGLVDELADGETLAARALAVAREMAGRAAAYAAIKTILRGPVAERIRQLEADSIRRFVDIWYSPSTREQTKKIQIRS